MPDIIPLDDYRQQCLIRAGYRRLQGRFGQTFKAQTRLSDLTPEMLCMLSEPGGEAITDLYALILGFLGYRAQMVFDELPGKVQMRVVDIHLFLSDQIRFEMMHRMGWLERFIGNLFALFDMVRDFDRIKRDCGRHAPVLAKHHPEYDAYRSLFELDQHVFMRRLFPEALSTFKDRYGS